MQRTVRQERADLVESGRNIGGESAVEALRGQHDRANRSRRKRRLGGAQIDMLANAVEAIDARADVYAIGVVAYELLSGSLPRELGSGSVASIVERITREQAPRLGKRAPECRGDVELIVDRVGKLDTHFRQARSDLDGIGTAAERAGKRAQRLDSFDFDEVEAEDPARDLLNQR